MRTTGSERGAQGSVRWVWMRAKARRYARLLKFSYVPVISAGMIFVEATSEVRRVCGRRPGLAAKALVIGLLLGAHAAVADAPDVPTIAATEAQAHVGERVRVCGVVASARYAPKSRGRPTFLNLERPYPKPAFTIVIWQENREAFGKPEVVYLHKRVCVTGTVKTYRGSPEIIATEPRQLSSD